ncbi:MAG: Holliday junction branch migration DNA helicase RuvB, partial [Paludibacteraceae bacterium]|nr:Holliday junction branch migration DNA helicase RuvB [Paludibacteraceae bacterium]
MNENFDIRGQMTEKEQDNALRPLRFDDFAGQSKIVSNLRIFVEAARMRGESLDHVLLFG